MTGYAQDKPADRDHAPEPGGFTCPNCGTAIGITHPGHIQQGERQIGWQAARARRPNGAWHRLPSNAFRTAQQCRDTIALLG
jgi:hypothetical protein